MQSLWKAYEARVKFQSDTIILTTNLADSRFREMLTHCQSDYLEQYLVQFEPN